MSEKQREAALRRMKVEKCGTQLLSALKLITRRYVDLVNCGDCGSWNPENDPEVQSARAAIAKAEEK